MNSKKAIPNIIDQKLHFTTVRLCKQRQNMNAYKKVETLP